MAENSGCSYGKVNRVLIENMKEGFERFVDNDFEHLVGDMKETKKSVSNIEKKQNKRPTWLTAIIIVGLTNLVVGLALAQILGK